MKEFRFVGFSLPDPEAVTRLLRRFDLEPSVAPGGYYCQVRLEADDPRLVLLLDELATRGSEPVVRAEREYTKRELDASDWQSRGWCSRPINATGNISSALLVAQQRQRAEQPISYLQAWALKRAAIVHANKAAVALANKLARVIWAVWTRQTRFDGNHLPVAA